MIRISKSFLLITLSLLVVACSVTPKKKPPVPAGQVAQEELAKIQVDIAAGADQKALNRLLNLANKYPGSDVSDDAYLLMGEIQFKRRNYLPAYEAFMSVVNSDIFSPSEGDALLWAAKSLVKLGRLDEALALTQKSIKIPGLSPSLAIENYKLRFSILNDLGDKIEALRALVYLADKDSDANSKNSHRMRALDYVESRLSEKELELVADRSEFSMIRPQAQFRYAVILFEQRDFSRARSYFSDVSNALPGSDFAERSQNYIKQIDARRLVDPRTVGAVLPLTGKHSAVAYRTLRGIQLGLGIYGREKSDLRLAVVDSEANPDTARKAVERLVTEDNAVAMIGSLLSRTATAVAGKADELGLPSICLSQKAGITDVGSYVFRNALTSEMQVRQIVEVAMNNRSLKRFAILYPNDAYGVEFANLFWDEVLARGGKIVGAQSYPSDTTDFSGPIRRLIGTYYLEDRTDEYQSLLKDWQKSRTSITGRTTPPDDLLPPIVQFDAIFIPDGIKALNQISPNLAYHDVDNVTVLGTNLWNSPTLTKTGDKLLESAIFVDSIYPENEEFRKTAFFRDFKAAFGEEPGLFEAQGYDAALAIRQALASGERTRSGVADRLRNLSQFKGALGFSKMTERRELTRPTFALAVHQGKILRFEQVPPPTPAKAPAKSKK